jgi:hypothetical protein
MQPIEFFVSTKPLWTVIHVLSAVIGMGSALASDFLFNMYARDKTLSQTEVKTLRFLSDAVWIGIGMIIVSGIGILFSNPEKYLQSSKFISKMGVMCMLLLNGVILSKFISPHLSDNGLLKRASKKSLRQYAFMGGGISVYSWVVVCSLGVLDSIPLHYTDFFIGYLAVLCCIIIGALGIEHFLYRDNK